MMQDDIVLDVKDLKVHFPVLRGLLKRPVAMVKAVDGVSFQIHRGETLGLVGESGCGKTTVGRTILRLYEPTSGQIIFCGRDISKLPEKDLTSVRRQMSLVFQDTYSSLNPRHSAGTNVGEPLRIHNLVHSEAEYQEKIIKLFTLVGLDPDMRSRYPHEFSGGQRQRLGIARSLSTEPSLIVCDEPVSALDVSIQAQIINLLKDLQKKLGLTYLFIAHDLATVRHISKRIAVMYLGRIVEVTPSSLLYRNPLHPYTKALLAAVPIADPFVEETRERIILQGEVPSPLNPPFGCTFHPRCSLAGPECKHEVPQLRTVEEGHMVACHKV